MQSDVVRLVRACGSKLEFFHPETWQHIGQARKSLWIETPYQCQGEQ